MLEVEAAGRTVRIVKPGYVPQSVRATDFSVVLFSGSPAHWLHNSLSIKTTRGNRAGRFRIEGIPDGDYFVAAALRSR